MSKVKSVWGFYVVPNLITDGRFAALSGNAVKVLNVIAFHGNGYGEGAFPARSTIAKEAGIGSMNTIDRCLRELVEAEVIKRDNRKGRSNIYTIPDLANRHARKVKAPGTPKTGTPDAPTAGAHNKTPNENPLSKQPRLLAEDSSTDGPIYPFKRVVPSDEDFAAIMAAEGSVDAKPTPPPAAAVDKPAPSMVVTLRRHGITMNPKKLLAEHPDATPADIDTALEGVDVNDGVRSPGALKTAHLKVHLADAIQKRLRREKADAEIAQRQQAAKQEADKIEAQVGERLGCSAEEVEQQVLQLDPIGLDRLAVQSVIESHLSRKYSSDVARELRHRWRASVACMSMWLELTRERMEHNAKVKAKREAEEDERRQREAEQNRLEDLVSYYANLSRQQMQSLHRRLVASANSDVERQIFEKMDPGSSVTARFVSQRWPDEVEQLIKQTATTADSPPADALHSSAA